MTSSSHVIMALDVGERRIGIAKADTDVKLAFGVDTVEVDGEEIKKISGMLNNENAEMVVLGYPRNQSGMVTKQTQYVEEFAERLKRHVDLPIVFQDESLTSVIAEDRLRGRGRGYDKSMIDSEAAAIILQDYMERNYG